MPDIVTFLLDRFSEDEHVARTASPGPWRPVGMTVFTDPEQGKRSTMVVEWTWPQESAHIVRHDPSRVLADLAVKRQIVELHRPVPNALPVGEGGGSYLACPVCPHAQIDVPNVLPCDTLCLLAAFYDEHPDYQQAWVIETIPR